MPLTNAIAEFAPTDLPTMRAHPFDPAPELSALRDQSPFCRLRYPDGHLGWLVTSHALAREMLADPRFTIKPIRQPVGDPRAGHEFNDAFLKLPEAEGVLINLDPPQHARIRSALAAAFTVRRASEHGAAIERIVAEHLDAMEQAGRPADLMSAFALPVASCAICELLGAPAGDRERFERPSVVMQDPSKSAEEKLAAVKEFMAYCRDLLAQKRAEPDEGLLSQLAAVDDLTEDEIVGIAFQLFSAGHETTSSMIALGTFALLRERERWDALRADPSMIDAAVEELLRYLTIVQQGAFTRTALEDMEFDGAKIQAGDSVTVSLAAANRDPEKFLEPDELDVHRDARGHVAFGHGRHMCLGQHMARLEMKVAFAALMRRFPTLRIAVPEEEISLLSGEHVLYGLHSLPVTWEEATR